MKKNRKQKLKSEAAMAFSLQEAQNVSNVQLKVRKKIKNVQLSTRIGNQSVS